MRGPCGPGSCSVCSLLSAPPSLWEQGFPGIEAAGPLPQHSRDIWRMSRKGCLAFSRGPGEPLWCDELLDELLNHRAPCFPPPVFPEASDTATSSYNPEQQPFHPPRRTDTHGCLSDQSAHHDGQPPPHALSHASGPPVLHFTGKVAAPTLAAVPGLCCFCFTHASPTLNPGQSLPWKADQRKELFSLPVPVTLRKVNFQALARSSPGNPTPDGLSGLALQALRAPGEGRVFMAASGEGAGWRLRRRSRKLVQLGPAGGMPTFPPVGCCHFPRGQPEVCLVSLTEHRRFSFLTDGFPVVS